MAMDRPENWNRLTLRNIDRQVFIKEFLKVRDIRNKSKRPVSHAVALA
jgi:hypothetical protein